MIIVVITKQCETSLTGTGFELMGPLLSDHAIVKFKISLIKRPHVRKWIMYRKLKSLDHDSFQTCIIDSLASFKNSNDLEELVESYTQSQKIRLITVRPCAAWYTDEIADAKKRRRRAERRWRCTKDPDDRLIYVKACKSVNSLIYRAKYATVFSENKGNQKVLFTTVNKLLHRNSGKVLPSSTSDINLAEQFADFFTNKVSAIHKGLTESTMNLHCNPSSEKVLCVSLSSTLSEFKLLSSGDIEEIIKSSPSKSCSLDPIPTTLLKDHLCVLLPLITRIVNLSLGSLFPSSLKKSIISPLLKKPSLDPDVMNHYRPVSNLSQR